MDVVQVSKAFVNCLSPELILIAGGILVICASIFKVESHGSQDPRQQRRYAIASLGILLCAVVSAALRGQPESQDLGLFRLDSTVYAAEKLTFLGGLIITLMSWSTAPTGRLSEYYGCLLIMFGGIPMVGASNDLVSLFLSLELVSIPTYILLGICKQDDFGAEAALKYFLLSAFASCLFLLGLSYLFGAAGSTNLNVIHKEYAEGGSLLTIGLFLSICGLSFRITAFPFYFYAPDVLQGTSVTLAGVLSYLPKVTGFVALFRLIGEASFHESIAVKLFPLLLAVAILTMFIGNLLALAQTNLRRIMAYSSVAHTGYVLVAFLILLQQNASPTVVFSYLAVYAVMTLGVFACLGAIEASGAGAQTLAEIKGVFQRSPLLAISLTIVLLSLIGLPLTAGFWAKFTVFMVVVSDFESASLSIALGVLVALNAALAAGYYWRIVSSLYSPSEKDTHLPSRANSSLAFAYGICTSLTVVWFFLPVQL